MKDRRWLWIDDQQSGPFTVAQIYRMAEREEIGPKTLFWSDVREQWFPLVGLMFDFEPGGLERMRASGIKCVKILDSGTGEDCPICHGLIGRKYQIDAPPTLPP